MLFHLKVQWFSLYFVSSKSRSTNLRPNVSMLSTNTFTPLSNVELPTHLAASTEQLSLQNSVPQQADVSQTQQQFPIL